MGRMSTERKLAELLDLYGGAEFKKNYAMRLSQLIAVCDLHRRTPLTREIVEHSGFELCGCTEYCRSYAIDDRYGLWFCNDDAPLVIYSDDIACESATLMPLRTVADLESFLDILGIDKQIRLPSKPCKEKEHQEEQENT